jgi:hypothetical protein
MRKMAILPPISLRYVKISRQHPNRVLTTLFRICHNTIVIVLVNYEVLIGSAAGTGRRLCPSCDLVRLRGSPLSPVQSDALTRGIFDWSK